MYLSTLVVTCVYEKDSLFLVNFLVQRDGFASCTYHPHIIACNRSTYFYEKYWKWFVVLCLQFWDHHPFYARRLDFHKLNNTILNGFQFFYLDPTNFSSLSCNVFWTSQNDTDALELKGRWLGPWSQDKYNIRVSYTSHVSGATVVAFQYQYVLNQQIPSPKTPSAQCTSSLLICSNFQITAESRQVQ